MTWKIVCICGAYQQIPLISERNWWFIIFSGLAGGISWLCYFKELQLGQPSHVVAVDKFSLVFTIILAFFILRDAISIKIIMGCILITRGTLMMI